MCRDRRIECRREDAFVLGEEVVRELVEIADSADHRRGSDHLVDVRGELLHQLDILRVALDEAVSRMVVVRLRQSAVLAEIVESHDVVTGFEELRDEIAVDESCRACDEDSQSRMPDPKAPQTSTTSLPPTSSPR